MHRNRMKIAVATLAAVLATTGFAGAATLVNRDSQPRMVTVTEGGQQSEVAVGPGQSVQFCASGCFVTLPNGDRQALTGSETVEISGGAATIR